MLMAKLTTKQKSLHLSDRGFSKVLRQSPTYWGQVKAGKWKIGKGVLTTIMREWPDLIPDVLAYLQQGDGHEQS